MLDTATFLVLDTATFYSYILDASVLLLPSLCYFQCFLRGYKG